MKLLLNSHNIHSINHKLIYKDTPIAIRRTIVSPLSLRITGSSLRDHSVYLVGAEIRDFNSDPLPLLSLCISSSCLQEIDTAVQALSQLSVDLSLDEMIQNLALLTKDVLTILSKNKYSIVLLPQVDWDVFHQIVESHIHHQLYDMAFYHIGQRCQKSSVVLASIIAKCRHIQLSHLGLSAKCGDSVFMAVNEFRTITALRSPIEKMQCICRTLGIFSKHIKHATLTSDLLIPLLAMVIVQTNMFNISAIIEYIKQFSVEKNPLLGQIGFGISCLDAAHHYLLQDSADLLLKASGCDALFECLEMRRPEMILKLIAEDRLLLNAVTANGDSPITLLSTLNDIEILEICNLA